MSDLEIELSAAALVDGVRDEMITLLKDMPDSFRKLDEKKQRHFIGRCSEIAVELARGCCDIIAADGRTDLDCTIGKVGINETTLEARISIARTKENLRSFGGAAHGPAKIAFVNYEKLTTEHDRPAPDPDQSAMFPEDEEGPEHVGDSVDKAVSSVVQKRMKNAASKTSLKKSQPPAPDMEEVNKAVNGEPDRKEKPKRVRKAGSKPRTKIERSTVRGRKGNTVSVERRRRKPAEPQPVEEA